MVCGIYSDSVSRLEHRGAPRAKYASNCACSNAVSALGAAGERPKARRQKGTGMAHTGIFPESRIDEKTDPNPSEICRRRWPCGREPPAKRRTTFPVNIPLCSCAFWALNKHDMKIKRRKQQHIVGWTCGGASQCRQFNWTLGLVYPRVRLNHRYG